MKIDDIIELKADGHTYQVVWEDAPELDGEVVWEYVDYRNLTIHMMRGLPETLKESLLIHAIHHIAGDDLYGFNSEERKGDRRFHVYSDNIFKILKDNGLLNL